MKPGKHSANLNYVRSILAKTRCLSRLKEGNLLGALVMAKLAIKYKVISMIS